MNISEYKAFVELMKQQLGEELYKQGVNRWVSDLKVKMLEVGPGLHVTDVVQKLFDYYESLSISEEIIEASKLWTFIAMVEIEPGILDLIEEDEIKLDQTILYAFFHPVFNTYFLSNSLAKPIADSRLELRLLAEQHPGPASADLGVPKPGDVVCDNDGYIYQIIEVQEIS